MAIIFGIDMANEINDAISDAGGVLPGILTHYAIGVRNPDDPTAGVNPVKTEHSIQGFVEQKEQKGGGVMASFYPKISILGASVTPMEIPLVNDTVEMEGITYTLLELLERDPASALYVFKAER